MRCYNQFYYFFHLDPIINFRVMFLPPLPPPPSSLLTRSALRLLLLLKDHFLPSQSETLIDLRGPNQAAQQYRCGLLPLTFQPTASTQQLSRKELLKRRYFDILEKEEKQKNHQIQRQKPKLIKLPKIVYETEEFKSNDSLLLRDSICPLFGKEQTCFVENIDNSQRQSNKLQTSAKSTQNEKIKQSNSSQESVLTPPNRQEAQKIPINPFLCATQQKLSLSDFIQSIEKNTTNDAQQNYPSTEKKNNIVIQPRREQRSVPERSAYQPQGLNMFSNLNHMMASAPPSTTNQFTVSFQGAQVSQQQSMAMFMAPAVQPQTSLFGAQNPANPSGRQRNRKKKGPARVYE